MSKNALRSRAKSTEGAIFTNINESADRRCFYEYTNIPCHSLARFFCINSVYIVFFFVRILKTQSRPYEGNKHSGEVPL